MRSAPAPRLARLVALLLVAWTAACSAPEPGTPSSGIDGDTANALIARAALRLQEGDGRWVAKNPGRGLWAVLDADGAHLRRPGETFDSLVLHASEPLKRIVGDPDRFALQRQGLVEWYENTPRGLHQGFTIGAPGPGGRVTVRESVGGNLRPEVLPDGRAVAFRDGRGAVVWRYQGLRAYDAGGRTLPAAIARDGGDLVITADAAGARFPVTIDPWLVGDAQVDFPDPTAVGGEGGASVAVDGTLAAVGVPDAPNGGEVYIYELNQVTGAWASVTRLQPSGMNSGARFGAAVALSSSRLLVGAPGYAQPPSNSPGGGAAWVFDDTSGTWDTGTFLKNTDGNDGSFGTSVTIDGTVLAIGDPDGVDPDTTTQTGRVTVLSYSSGQAGWLPTALVYSGSAAAGNEFGASVSLSGGLLLAGEPKNGTGAAWVIDVSGSSSPVALGGEVGASDFGAAVDLDGTTALVGSPGESSGAGAAYVFAQDQGGAGAWGEVQRLVPSAPAAGDGFGTAVALLGTHAVVGAPSDADVGTNAGSAWLFENSGTWSETGTVWPETAGETFGSALAFSGSRVALGAPVKDDGSGNDAGAVYFETALAEPVLATNAGITVLEGGSGTIPDTALLVTDADTTASNLVYTVTQVPAHGTLSTGLTFTQADIDAGALSYTHDHSETTSDQFVFTVSDGTGYVIGPYTFPITVTAVNDPPHVDVDLPIVVDEAHSGTIDSNVLSTSDPDNTPAQLTYSVTSGPSYGTLTFPVIDGQFTQADLNDGGITYTEDGTHTSEDQFDFSVSDGASSVPGTFHITVTNQPPTVDVDAGLTVDEGTAGTIDSSLLSASDAETPGSGLTFEVTSGPSHGTLSATTFTEADLTSGGITYTHDGTHTSSDSFAFTVSDGALKVAGTFPITITNQPPTVDVDAGLTVDQGATGTIDSTLLSASDAESPASAVVFTVTGGPSHGTLSTKSFTEADLQGAGITYTHDGTHTSSDSFTFTVSDGALEVSGTFHIVIGGVNDPPVVAVNEPLQVLQGGSATLDDTVLQATDPDNTADQLTWTLVAEPGNGVLQAYGAPLAAGDTFTQADIDEGYVSYAHDNSETSADHVDLQVADPLGATPGPITLSVVVEPVNQHPVAVDDGPYHVQEGGVLNVDAQDGVLANDTDPENDALTAILSLGAVNGDLQLQPDGGFEYTPNPGFSGSDRFGYTASDGQAPSNLASAIIVVDPVADTGTDTGQDTGSPPPGQCGCASVPSEGSSGAWLLLLAPLVGVRRRRRGAGSGGGADVE